jgi:riboflavin kinase/FMN adenylyltransferase
MRIQRGFQQPADYRGGWLTIGNFDGVHRGHQSMLATLVAQARAAGRPAVLMTFDPHPIAILRPEQAPPALSLLEHRLELFERHGVDTAIVYPTDARFLQLTPQEFFQQIVLAEIDAAGLVEGPNFFFGQGRAGTVQTLRSLCAEAKRQIQIVSAVIVADRMVSSSEVRKLISAGDLALAVKMLGHPYRVRGAVVRGAARGRTIGFPTANLADVATLLPALGVYAGRCQVAGRVHPAAIHLGPNPTFGECEPKLEVHLLDFTGDLYGQTLDVDFLSQIRPVMRFDSSDALQQQLKSDLAAVRTLANVPAEG